MQINNKICLYLVSVPMTPSKTPHICSDFSWLKKFHQLLFICLEVREIFVLRDKGTYIDHRVKGSDQTS